MTSTLVCEQQLDNSTKFIINVGIGDPVNWGVSIYSNVDYGRGSTGSHDPAYPYFVENFYGSNTQTLYNTYPQQGGYIGTLAPTSTTGGYSYCYFTVAGPGGICPTISSATVSGPTSVTQGSTQTFTINWLGVGPSGTTYNIDLYKDVSYYRSFTATGSPTSTTIIISSADFPIGNHTLFANVWYQCSDGSTISTGLGSGFGVSVTGPGGICPTISSATVSGPTSVTQGSTQTFTINWLGVGPSGTTYNIDLYKDVSYYRSFSGTGSPASISVTINAADFPSGNHALFANVWYQCSDGSTISTGLGSGFGVSVTGTTVCTPGVTPCSSTCITGTCPSGYICSSTGICMPVGGGGGLPTCDPIQCPLDKNYCLLGTCIPKTYATYGIIGFGALFLLSILK